MTTYGERRAGELDAVATSVRSATFLDARIVENQSTNGVHNVMYLIAATPVMIEAATRATADGVAFAHLLAAKGMLSLPSDPEIENLRRRALASIKALQDAISTADPSDVGKHLGPI